MTIDAEMLSLPQEVICFHELLPALRRLDSILARAVDRAQIAFGANSATDRFRGLYITDAEVERMLSRSPGDGMFAAAIEPMDDVLSSESRLAWLAEAFGLEPLDVDVVVLALAPEIDLRYERLYAYLHDDVTRRRPTVDLALSLFCDIPHARAAARSHFAFDAPLLRKRLITLSPEGAGSSTSLLGQPIQLDEQIINLLLGHDGLDRRLNGCCRFDPQVATADAGGSIGRAARRALTNVVRQAREQVAPLRLHFHGPQGSGRHSAARTIAADVGAPMLSLDVSRLIELADANELVAIAVRDAWLHGAVLVVSPWAPLEREERAPLRSALEDALAEHPVVAIALASAPPATNERAISALSVEFTPPAADARRNVWSHVIAESGSVLDDTHVDALASQFRLTRRQIEEAAAAARSRAWWRAANDATTATSSAAPRAEDWFAGARAQGGDELATLATRVQLSHVWSDLVLPQDSLAQLRELCDRVAQRGKVMTEWGFDRRLSRGRGINALFSGPSGTGKTMAAEIIARELELDLFRIELSGVVSKYIGETEKNLDRIFSAAERANGVVLFDEADALFGKRSEVHDSHDRYANLEISYLLQKMEQFDGIAILATNLRGNLDEAFIRRLAFTVHFPFPDVESRRRIWSAIWPTEAPRAADLDFEFLARQFAMSGGNIKNIALGAAFFAAERGDAISMRDLMRATVREYQKLGKALTTSELGAHAALVE